MRPRGGVEAGSDIIELRYRAREPFPACHAVSCRRTFTASPRFAAQCHHGHILPNPVHMRGLSRFFMADKLNRV